jgi:hypothetical protein
MRWADASPRGNPCNRAWLYVSKVTVSESVCLIEVHRAIQYASLILLLQISIPQGNHSQLSSEFAMAVGFHKHVIVGCFTSPRIGLRLMLVILLKAILNTYPTLVILWNRTICKLLGRIQLSLYIDGIQQPLLFVEVIWYYWIVLNTLVWLCLLKRIVVHRYCGIIDLCVRICRQGVISRLSSLNSVIQIWRRAKIVHLLWCTPTYTVICIDSSYLVTS